MDELDNKIKDILGRIKKPESRSSGGDCPEESLLACYSEGLLKDSEREWMEQHLLACGDCLQITLLNEKMKRDEVHETIPEAPMEWMERAKNLLPRKEASLSDRLFDVVLKFAKETIETIGNPGNMAISYGAMPVPVRGEEKVRSSRLVTVKKVFTEVELEAEVERVGEKLANIKVLIKEVGSGLPVQDLRISLFQFRREIASYVAENGESLFSGLKFGDYFIKVTKQGREIGKISLKLKE